MKIGVFVNSCARAGIPVMDAFVKGIRATGDTPITLSKPENTDVDAVVLWSVLWTMPIREQVYNFYNKHKIPIIVLEVGGIVRNITWKVGIGNINSEGIFLHKNQPTNRWNRFGLPVLPYKTTGKNIIICGQNERSAVWPFGKTENWLRLLIAEIREYSNKPIIFRPHPRFPVKVSNKIGCTVQIPKFKGNYDNFDFQEALRDAYLIINHNSNPSIEATLQGINIYTGESSLCYDVSIKNIKNINNLPNPDRTTWLNEIAHTEWFVEEIEQGIPYKRLRDYIK